MLKAIRESFLLVRAPLCPRPLGEGTVRAATLWNRSPSPHSSPVKGEDAGSRPYLKIAGLTVLLALLPFQNAIAENVKIGIPSLTVTMMPVAVAKEQGF